MPMAGSVSREACRVKTATVCHAGPPGLETLPAGLRLAGVMAQQAEPSTLKSFAERIQDGVVVCDGAMGTMLYSRGVFVNRCFDELNLSNPDLVRSIHEEYVDAGAD